MGKDPKIDLSVSYNYGDIDRYTLTASTKNMEWKGKWLSDEDIVIPNYVQPYCKRIEHALDGTSFEGIIQGIRDLDNIENSVKNSKSGVVYEFRGTRYSKLFYRLNKYGRAPSFFNLRDIASADTDRRKLLIRTLYEKNRIFSLISIRNGTHYIFELLSEEEKKTTRENAGKICLGLSAVITANPEDFPDIDKEWFTGVFDTLTEDCTLFDLIALSAYTDPYKDPHSLWPVISKGIAKEARRLTEKYDPYRANSLLRLLSGICWLTENWIYGLSPDGKGRQTVENILLILETAIEAEFHEVKASKDPVSMKKMRDYLELLLCLCRLKTDEKILDNNGPQAKRIVRRLKNINKTVRTMHEEGRITEDNRYSDSVFCTRINFQEDEDWKRLYRVYPLILSIIKVLTGMKPAVLLGYSEDEQKGA